MSITQCLPLALWVDWRPCQSELQKGPPSCPLRETWLGDPLITAHKARQPHCHNLASSRHPAPGSCPRVTEGLKRWLPLSILAHNPTPWKIRGEKIPRLQQCPPLQTSQHFLKRPNSQHKVRNPLIQECSSLLHSSCRFNHENAAKCCKRVEWF